MGALDEVKSVVGASVGRSSVRCLEKARVPDSETRSGFGRKRCVGRRSRGRLGRSEVSFPRDYVRFPSGISPSNHPPASITRILGSIDSIRTRSAGEMRVMQRRLMGLFIIAQCGAARCYEQ